MATIQQKIAGLYIAFFNRASDKAGLDYWEDRASTLGEDVAVKELAAGFATHPKFTDLYNGLSNQQFVEAIYTNTLGQAGDIEGIGYWTTLLDQGMSKSDMVAEFISISLDFDSTAPQYLGLTADELQSAQQRQSLITNKATLSLDYVNLLSTKTNLNSSTNPSNTSSLDSDPAFQASIKVLSTITDDTSTVDSVINGLNLLKDRDDAISILNSVSVINQQNISNQIEPITNELSNINNGLGALSDISTHGVSAIDSEVYWDEDIKEITYSFNSSIPSEYQSDREHTSNWQQLDTTQQNTVHTIMSELNKLLDVKFVESTNSNNGMIRFNVVEMAEEGVVGFAYYPDEGVGGDVFLSQEFNNPDSDYDLGLEQGEGGFLTIAHELGHALGLEHPFDGEITLPSSEDNMNYTIMSYTQTEYIAPIFSASGSSLSLHPKSISPSLYSLYDVEALQKIYGANTQTATGDDIYTTKYTDYEIQTIWDAGGNDTIDLSATTGKNHIDLHSGSLNSVDQQSVESIIAIHQEGITRRDFKNWIKEQIIELDNQDLLYTGKDNFAITQGVIIENIKTGSGNDYIIDNEVDNSIYAGEGNDQIYIGAGGYDHIDGGGGEDSLYLDILKNQIEIQEINTETYNIIADNFGAEIIGIEKIYFSNGDVYDL